MSIYGCAENPIVHITLIYETMVLEKGSDHNEREVELESSDMSKLSDWFVQKDLQTGLTIRSAFCNHY